MKKILVTGAGGLVGSCVADALSAHKEFEVFRICHGCTPADSRHVFQMDLEHDCVENLRIRFDCIVHCAAKIPDQQDQDEAAAMTNRAMDDRIIRYCGIQKCRLIYLSGVSVYKQKHQQMATEDSETDTDTRSRYIREKRMTEQKIQKTCGSYCILRISSPYGAMQKHLTVLKIFIDAVCTDQDLYYFGTGERTQDFIDAGDVAQAVLRSVEYEENGIFNIAAGQSVSMRQLAELTAQIGKREIQSASRVRAKDQADAQEQVRVNIDISLAQKRLGWKPQTSLEDGICRWLRERKRLDHEADL